MKRCNDALVFVPMVLVIVAMAVLGWYGIARAEPVQQFAFQITDPQPHHLTVRVLLRRFDSTGGVPPTPTEFSMLLPRGVGLNPAFLTSRYFCDGTALRDALDARPNGVPFTRRLTQLGAFARELSHSHSKRDRAALANVRACMRGQLGGGTGLIDARAAIAVLTDPIPVHFSMFLSRGSVPGAIAGFTILGAADEQSPIVRRYPVVAGVHAVVTENLLPNPDATSPFGLKYEIFIGPINGFQVSIAAVDARAHTLFLPRGTCLATGRGGRCTRRQRADASLFEVPRCPAIGHFSTQLSTTYPPPTASETTTLDVPCPRYAS